MNLLYISSYHCHLERMELELFHELGIKFISTGKFLDPRNPRMESLAAPLNIDINGKWAYRFNKLNPNQKKWASPVLSKEFVDYFDAIYVGHCGPNPNYLQRAWSFIKHKPVIMRTYGLQSPVQELFYQKCKHENSLFYLVRFSPNESIIQNFAGVDASIFPYVDENAYNNWNGSEKQIYTAQNWYKSRYNFDNYAFYEGITSPYKRITTGIEAPNGVLTPQAQKEHFRNSRVYFGLGTRPSPITINIFEALMTGMPVVTWSYKYGSTPDLNMYQIPELITNYINGLCSDDKEEIQAFVNRCMDDYNYAKKIGDAGRQLALRLFSKATIKQQWRAFLKSKSLLPSALLL